MRDITPFKVMVIEVGISRKPVCDFLLVINSNWHPISYRFWELSQLIFQILDNAFLSLGGLRDNVRCSSWAYWKARSRLRISVNWTFFAMCYGWCAMVENRSKIGVLKAGGSVCAKFSRRRRRPPPIIFAWIVRPVKTTSSLTVLTQGKLCSRLSSSEVRFYTENGLYSFLSPHPLGGGWGATFIIGSLESALSTSY